VKLALKSIPVKSQVIAAIAITTAMAGLAAVPNLQHGTTRVGAQGSTEANYRGIAINGVYVNHVKYDGKLLSVKQYIDATQALRAAGRTPLEYYDGWNVKTGYFLATSSPAVFASWQRGVAAQAHTATVSSTGSSSNRTGVSRTLTSATGVTCSFSKGLQYTVMWDGSSCSGNYEILGPGQSRSGVLYNDAYSALEIGCKISDVTVYKNSNFVTPSKLFGNSSGNTDYAPLGLYTYQGTTQTVNDSISSYSSVASSAC
jgi:hypothetical protein